MITFDLAFYVKAKETQLTFTAGFSNTLLRLGSFHIALNFLSIIGKKHQSSGLKDLLIESRVYAAGRTTALINGRSYNTGVRAHNLCFEAFSRLLWKVFLVLYSPEEEGRSALMAESTTRKLAACRAKVDARASTIAVVEDLESLREGLQDIIEKHEEFKEERQKVSKLFAFWEEYGTMVDLLLQLTKAERTENWKLHLCTVAAMIPYFFAMDWHNYSHWLPVSLSDMKHLETKHPRVH